jgi:hypothetical protein
LLFNLELFGKDRRSLEDVWKVQLLRLQWADPPKSPFFKAGLISGLIYWKKNNAETQLLHLSSIYIRSRLNDRNGLERFFSGGWISPAF